MWQLLPVSSLIAPPAISSVHLSQAARDGLEWNFSHEVRVAFENIVSGNRVTFSGVEEEYEEGVLDDELCVAAGVDAGPQYRSDKSRKPRKTGFPLKMLRERPGY